MNITNDTVTFDAADVAGLSPQAKAALSTGRPPTTPEQRLSELVTSQVRVAINLFVRDNPVASSDDLHRAMAFATPAKRAAAEAFIAQARSVLSSP